MSISAACQSPASVAVRADATPDPRIICRHAALENTLISCPFRVNLKKRGEFEVIDVGFVRDATHGIGYRFFISV